MPPSISVCSLSVGTLVLQREQQRKEAGWCLDSNTHQSTKPQVAEDNATKWIKQGVSRRVAFLACLAFILQNEGVTWWDMRWRKQVPNTKSKVIFLNVYLLLNFSFHLEFLGRTLCQTGKDDIAHFEGILEKTQEQFKKYFQTLFGKRRDFKLSLSFCTMRNQVFSCENGSNK